MKSDLDNLEISKKDYDRVLSQGKKEDMEKLLEYALINFKKTKQREDIIIIKDERVRVINKDIPEVKDISSDKIKETKKDIEAQEKLLKLLKEGKLWDKIVLEELDKKHIGDKKTKEVIFLCSLGRLVKNKKSFSYNCLVLAPSSSGKDYLVSSVLDIFPEQDYEHFKRVSPKALNYLHAIKKTDEDEEIEPYDYDGKILYLEEIEENVLNNEVMKGFTSGEKRINQCAITRDKGRGVEVIKVMGHPCVFSTTATTIPNDEIRNRFNIVGLDLSEEQTRNTFKGALERLEYKDEIKQFLAKLKPYNVEIPKEIFNFISDNFPKNKIRLRRDFPRFLDFVKAVTIFNQSTRQKQDKDTLKAEWDDYDTAKEVFMNAYSSVGDIPLKDIDRRIVEVLEKDKEPLQAREICDKMGGVITLSNLYNHLRDLTLKEILTEFTATIEPFNRVTIKYGLSEEFKDKKPFKLPCSEDKK